MRKTRILSLLSLTVFLAVAAGFFADEARATSCVLTEEGDNVKVEVDTNGHPLGGKNRDLYVEIKEGGTKLKNNSFCGVSTGSKDARAIFYVSRLCGAPDEVMTIDVYAEDVDTGACDAVSVAHFCAGFPFTTKGGGEKCSFSGTIGSSNPCKSIADNDSRGLCEKCLSKEAGKSGSKYAYTALGCLPVTPGPLAGTVLKIGIMLGGSAAILFIIFGGASLMFSAGDPQKVQQAKEVIVSAVSGLMLILFSLVILRVIGVDILGIPEF